MPKPNAPGLHVSDVQNAIQIGRLQSEIDQLRVSHKGKSASEIARIDKQVTERNRAQVYVLTQGASSAKELTDEQKAKVFQTINGEVRRLEGIGNAIWYGKKQRREETISQLQIATKAADLKKLAGTLRPAGNLVEPEAPRGPPGWSINASNGRRAPVTKSETRPPKEPIPPVQVPASTQTTLQPSPERTVDRRADPQQAALLNPEREKDKLTGDTSRTETVATKET